MANAVAGDTWTFQNGTYNLTGLGSGVDYHNAVLEPAHSGTSGNNIVFQAQTQGGAILSSPADGSSSPKIATIIGTHGANYITFNGFKLVCSSGCEAMAYFYETTGSVFENNEVVGASETNNGNNTGAMKIEATINSTIQNNWFHGVADPGADWDTAALFLISSGETQSGNQYLNNTFTDNSENVYIKFNSTNETFAYNYFGPQVSPASGYGAFLMQNVGGSRTT